ncbi:MAG TPA: glucosidase, partial [Trichormus sp.]
RRGLGGSEFELTDSAAFDNNKYFDVFAEYAKNSPDDILIKITVFNRADEPARLHVLPTLWFRNNWSWGCSHEGCGIKPILQLINGEMIEADQETLGRYFLAFDQVDGALPAVLFTDNHTNSERLFGIPNDSPYVKDAFHEYVVGQRTEAVNQRHLGTKAAPHYILDLAPGQGKVLRLRLVAESEKRGEMFGKSFDQIFEQRIEETDAFYSQVISAEINDDKKQVARQAYAGLLWNKQFYHYVVRDWLDGDAHQVRPPEDRKAGRNREWHHLFNRDVISMPDKWEFPWFAVWDLAFHMLPFAHIDAEFAKSQLTLFLREWYMHPNGQMPAYEYALSDVNPPVHAWAVWRVYKISAKSGQRDFAFLESAFQKLLLNFTWWVNRKDAEGNNLFSGGFLGLDNIGVFDRSKQLPSGGFLQQADGTAWMAFYCLTMLSISIELASHNPVYEDMASKFFEHFVGIADAINQLGGSGLWDETDGFYYDQIKIDHHNIPLKLKSLVGLLPMIAVEVLEESVIDKLPGFKKRMEWFLQYRKDLERSVGYCGRSSSGRILLSLPSRARLESLLSYLLDENEFLSTFGIRSVSKIHSEQPYVFHADGQEYRVDYVPGESNTYLFGGNSNWRGPIWFPINYLIIEALQKYDHFFGDDLKVEVPSGSGKFITLRQAADDLSKRLSSIFLADHTGRRPCHGEYERYATDPHWQKLVLFNEYFHGETGRGLGASHQTGWTALVARLVQR